MTVFKSGAVKKLFSMSYWLKGVLVLGLLLALLLILQSFLGYLRVSRQLITDQLEKDAERQVAALERELRNSGAADSQQLKGVLEEIFRESPQKYAWIQVIDSNGSPLAQAGEVVGSQIVSDKIRAAFEEHVWISDIRKTAGGEVRIAILPLRIRMPRTAPRANGQETMALTGPISPAPRPRVIELAIYLESVAAAYAPLRRNLITSCLAAISLAIAIVLLWLQFPRYVRSKQLEEQLELARRVQADLLPSPDPALGSLDFAASCVAAWQVGGDFYDVFTTESGRIAFVLGDVSGKGIPAALLMGLLHGAVRAIGGLDTAEGHESSSSRLNRLLATQTSADRFASLFWGYYDPETKLLRYVNAGHLPPALIRRKNNGELKIHRLTEGGPILGVLPDAIYRQGTAVVEPGDLFVLYSDGIVEASTASGEEFSEERLWAAVQNNWNKSSIEIRDEVLLQVHGFLRGERPQDDMTLLVVRLEGDADFRPALLPERTRTTLELPMQPLSIPVCQEPAFENSFTSI
jgi:serine phosphatase RsbU (regulator of sigma subunit)